MCKVIIIGAGPAGLTAAYELLKRSSDYDVLILEESDMVGGISRTVNHNGNRMDMGGHRFFSKSSEVNAWWESMMPTQGKPSFDDEELKRESSLSPNGPDPNSTNCVMLRRHRLSRIFFNQKFFDYPISLRFETLRNMGFLTTMQVGFSYLHACLFKHPENSLEDFYINRFGRKLYSMFFERYTQNLWGRHPREISPEWGAQRVKGLSVTTILKDMAERMSGKKDRKVETSLIEEFSYPKYGPGQMWELTAEQVIKMGGKIIFGAKVTGVKKAGKTDATYGGEQQCEELLDGTQLSKELQNDARLNIERKNGRKSEDNTELEDSRKSENSRIISITYLKEGLENTLSDDIVISSMPLRDLVAGMNNVPQEIRSIASGLPYRDYITAGILVKKLYLKNNTRIPTYGDNIPDNWIYVHDRSVKVGRLQIFNNWSPYMVKDVRSTVWIGLEYFCNEGDDLWSMSDKAFAKMAVLEMRKMGLIHSKADLLDWHVERVRKAYPAYFDTYKDIDKLRGYLDGIENLYCIGRNGQHRYNNMDHSMCTAFEAVNNILTGKREKDNIWNVNTEKEYHEKKDYDRC